MARIVDTLVTFASHESAKSVTDTENTEKSVQSILDKEDGVRREWFDCSNFCGMAVQSC